MRHAIVAVLRPWPLRCLRRCPRRGLYHGLHRGLHYYPCNIPQQGGFEAQRGFDDATWKNPRDGHGPGVDAIVLVAGCPASEVDDEPSLTLCTVE